DAHVVIAAVEPGRDLAIVGVVGPDVGVKQIEGDAADLDAPDTGPYLAARHGRADEERRAVRLRFRNQGQIVEVIFRIALLLPAVDVEVLAKVAFAVHEAHAG